MTQLIEVATAIGRLIYLSSFFSMTSIYKNINLTLEFNTILSRGLKLEKIDIKVQISPLI